MTTMRGRAVLLLALPALAGCLGAMPSRYYMLTPAPPTEGAARPAATARPAVSIGDISIPEAIDRPQLVRRLGPNRLEFSEFDRWAEPIGDRVRQVLRRDIAARLDTTPLMLDVPPRPGAPVRKIVVTINRFDANPAGTVVLNAEWLVLGGRDERALAAKQAEITEQGRGPDFDAVAAAMSRALGQLADRIVADLGT